MTVTTRVDGSMLLAASREITLAWQAQIPAITTLVYTQALKARDALADATPIGQGDTGEPHAADQWSAQQVGPFAAAVDNASDHIEFLLQPTRPHLIMGRPLLVFETEEGDMVFTPYVEHPGTQPNAALLAALDDQTAAGNLALETFGGKAVTKMAATLTALGGRW